MKDNLKRECKVGKEDLFCLMELSIKENFLTINSMGMEDYPQADRNIKDSFMTDTNQDLENYNNKMEMCI